MTLVVASPPSVQAQELEEGFTISKENIDRALTSTFEGHKIRDILPESLEYMIRNWGLKIRLGKAKPLDIPIQEALTQKYSDQVTFDPETRKPSDLEPVDRGWIAGIPFPDVEPGDPHAGIKAYWNSYLARPFGNYYDCRGKNVILNVNAEGGVYKQVVAVKNLYRMRGRFVMNPEQATPEDHYEGNGTIEAKKFLYLTAPYDVRGIGNYILRYIDGRPDASWVYIRSIRRIRRTSGGTWMDYAPASPALNSEASVEEAYPTWFKEFELLDKKVTLAPYKTTGGTLPVYHENAPTMNEKHEMFDLESWPHWNLDHEVVEWQPIPMYIIKMIPPDEHPYGKKILYVDARNWTRMYAEDYDKKGEFWKIVMRAHKRVIGMDGMKLNGEMGFGPSIDFRRKEAELVSIGHECAYNSYGVKAEDLTVEQLEKTKPPPRGRR